MKLNKEAENRYSDRDQTLFSIISQNGKINSKEITRKFYGRARTLPLNAQRIVFGDVNRLREKIHRNKEPFEIVSTKRSGPNPMVFWVEKRT